MSARTTQFDSETGRSLARSSSQPRSRSSEGRHEPREGRGAHRSRATDVEPTEVSSSQKKTHGKTSEKAQLLKISKARIHAASAISGDNSPQSLEYVSSAQHSAPRNTQDYSSQATSNLYGSMHMADSERTKFMDNIPGIPSNEQLAQRGDRTGRPVFPPPSGSSYGQNVAFPTSLSSELKALPRDANNTTDLVFHKSPANRHAKSLRAKGHSETEMQWNVSQENNNYRLRDEQRNRAATSEFHYSRTRGRRSKDGVNIVYNDVKFSGLNRQNVSRRSTSTSSYSESPDSQGSSTESESFTSSDSSLKRRRRIRRKPSNKSIGSSMYGEDNTSESENQSVSELSASDSAYSHRKRRTQFAPEEPALGPLVSYKEYRNTTNRLRSSSLTSVSSLEGVGISGDSASRNQSPLISPKGTSISKVRKIQIRSFTSFADSQLNNKENLPQRRRSTEEKDPFKIRGRAETAPKEISRPPLTRQGSESPSLSKSPFSLKSKAFVRKTSKENLFSDSECNHTSDNGHTSAAFDVPVGQEQVTRCNSAPPVSQPIETREGRSHHNLPDASGLLSSRSAFVPVKPNKRTNDHEPSPPIVAPATFVADSRPDTGSSATSADVLLRPVARNGNRPLSIVQETDEFADIMQEDDSYNKRNVENIFKKSHLTRSSPIRNSQELRASPPSIDENTSISTLRRLSYVKAQTNSAELPVHMPDVMTQTLDINSNSDSSPSFSPSFTESPPLRRFVPEATCETKRVLKEFDPMDPHEVLRTVASPVAEGDLISFEDENGEVKEPVKKRTKRITRPKIPTILGGEEIAKAGNVEDLENFDATRNSPDENDVPFSKGKLQIIN